MCDRYDLRWSTDRDRADFGDRSRGSHGATSDRDHAADPRDVFTKDLDLPRGRERRPVRVRDRVYEINGAESRMLATVGALRVVSETDLHDDRVNMHKGLRHLEREGLMRTSPLSSDDRAVVLTDRGRDLLEANRHERQERTWEPRQTFYAGLRRPREVTHDSKVYRAYLRAEERLREKRRAGKARGAGLRAQVQLPAGSRGFEPPAPGQYLEDGRALSLAHVSSVEAASKLTRFRDAWSRRAPPTASGGRMYRKLTSVASTGRLVRAGVTVSNSSLRADWRRGGSCRGRTPGPTPRSLEASSVESATNCRTRHRTRPVRGLGIA